MPTYEYLCKSCGHQFEKFQSMKDKPLKKCPECGKTVQRLIGTGGGVLFKGSGFYQTDYRPKSYHESAKKDAPAGGCGSEAPKSCDKPGCDSGAPPAKSRKKEA